MAGAVDAKPVKKTVKNLSHEILLAFNLEAVQGTTPRPVVSLWLSQKKDPTFEEFQQRRPASPASNRRLIQISSIGSTGIPEM